MTEEQEIAAGQRVAALLGDEAVKEAFDRLEKTYYASFKNADTRDARDSAWAKARVLDDVRQELRVVVDRGATADAMKQRRERGTSRR